MKRLWLVGSLAGCVLLLGACAGDRHLGPRGAEAFDGIFAQQTAPKFDPQSAPQDMIGDEGEIAVSNIKLMSTRTATMAAPAPLMPLSR